MEPFTISPEDPRTLVDIAERSRWQGRVQGAMLTALVTVVGFMAGAAVVHVLESGEETRGAPLERSGLNLGLEYMAVPALPHHTVSATHEQKNVVTLTVISQEMDSVQHRASSCPPRTWVSEELGSGSWIINETDSSWSWYMEFLKINKSAWPAEFHASDIHRYSFWQNASGLFYIMNHTIPASGFHLLFEANSNGEWMKNPYPVLTPAGFDPHGAKVNLLDVRYAFEEPGIPFDDSCHAWRCDMPIVQNVSVGGKIVPTEFIVSFWRELTSPTEMRCTLYITEANTGKTLSPWNEAGYGPVPSSQIPGKPQRLSYRYFRKTVQSFEDVEKRLPCVKTGIPGDDHQFC